MNELATLPDVDDRQIIQMPQAALSPAQMMDKGKEASNALMSAIRSNAISTPVVIGNSEHLRIEHWALIASFFQTSIGSGDSAPVEIFGQKGFKATGHVYDGNGRIIGNADAYCMDGERNWSDSDLFAMASMAQTRAASKAAGLKYRWVAVLAGYSGTPAEEMTGKVREQIQARSNPPAPKPIPPTPRTDQERVERAFDEEPIDREYVPNPSDMFDKVRESMTPEQQFDDLADEPLNADQQKSEKAFRALTDIWDAASAAGCTEEQFFPVVTRNEYNGKVYTLDSFAEVIQTHNKKQKTNKTGNRAAWPWVFNSARAYLEATIPNGFEWPSSHQWVLDKVQNGS